MGPLTTSLHNGASCVDGQGLVFDGIDDHASLAPGQYLGPAVTLSVWVWYNAGAHSVTPLLDFENPGGGCGGDEIYMGDFPRVILHSSGRVTSSLPAPTGEWVHLVATASTAQGGTSNSMNIYLNGVLADTASASVTQAMRSSLWVGRNTCSNTYLSGKINSLEMWNSSLSDAQVSALHAAASSAEHACNGVTKPRASYSWRSVASLNAAIFLVPHVDLCVSDALTTLMLSLLAACAAARIALKSR